MKNLSAIPCLSLSETFTILITLVVCLAGFTEAEVLTNYEKQDANQQEENYHLKEAPFKRNVPYAHQTSKMIEDEPEDRNAANFKNIPLEKLIKRRSDDFGESFETDERESDGYGYDDDEYYHFNFKRNDENLENTKQEKEGVRDSNEKEGIAGQKYMNANQKEKAKEVETIEMLNFKEIHPPIEVDSTQNSMEPKPFSDDVNRKKVPSTSNIVPSLKMSDIRGATAIDEKMKDRKDESSLSSGSSESKASDTKKAVKVTEEKDTLKLKDSKLAEDSEQKEKETNLKDGKEAVVGKGLKENPKSAEDKEKGVNLSENVKLQENMDKIGGKTKESDSPKLTREDSDNTRYSDKVALNTINPGGLNQISNRASFVSNDYKDNPDALKTVGAEEDEKTSEEMNDMGSTIGLGDYQDDQDNFRQFYNQREAEENHNYATYGVGDTSQIMQDASKMKGYTPLAVDIQGLDANDFFKRRNWKDAGEALRYLTQQSQPISQQQQQQQAQSFFPFPQDLAQDPTGQRQADMNTDNRFKNSFSLNFPSHDIENTEYHKNFIKSLKRYKGLSSEQKMSTQGSNGGINQPSGPYGESRNGKKRIQDTVKRSMDAKEEEKGNAQEKHSKLRRNVEKTLSQCPRNAEGPQSLSKFSADDTKLLEGTKQEDSTRTVRRSPMKLEYEIKVINRNSADAKNAAELSQITTRRFEKDLKTKLAGEEKYLKKYPYSQVSRDELMRMGESGNEKKFKRKAPIWKRHDKKSAIHTRAVPSGYYGNRVKFGQKNYARNNDRMIMDSASLDVSHPSSSYLSKDMPVSYDKSKIQRSWDARQQDYKHDPMKRYDESGYMNKGNPLLLVKKGERKATTFEEVSPQRTSESGLNPDNLAKILSKDNDYIVLKKTENNKFQKISEGGLPQAGRVASAGFNNYLTNEDDEASLKSNANQGLKSKALFVRSFHPEKEDKKISGSHSSKSNLKKTFEKFRDLAGFFKDNEQESTDNQYSAQELKEGRDIVFSEDKLPDPIVISNDGSGKNLGFNQKQQNSIYSISTNFKTLDQQEKKGEVPPNAESDKNMFTADAKVDSSESTWEPALKNIFPEAKSINTLSKNGNEIIILDLNRNQLKTDHPFAFPAKNSAGSSASAKAPYGAFGSTSQVPPSNNDNSIQVTLNALPMKLQPVAKVPPKNSFFGKLQNSRAYAVVKTADDGSEFSIRELSDLPNLLKALTEKQTNMKKLTKRSPEGQTSENYKKFLTDLNELSEMNKNKKLKFTKKRSADEILLPASSFSELSTYGDANIKYLGNLLHNFMTGEDPEFKSNGIPWESSDNGLDKIIEENLKSNQMFQNSGTQDGAKYQRRWLTTEEKGKEVQPMKEAKVMNYPFIAVSGENQNNQQDIWSKLAAASDKINQLRREGAGTRKLRKTIEESLAFRDKNEPETVATSEAKCIKRDSESAGLGAKDKMAFGSELKSKDEMKQSSDKSFAKSDYDNHLSEFFENVNSNKNLRDQLNIQNENTWKRKKRKENHRRKRSASLDVKNKVSTTAVQNTILKNLPEDNYQSIYSPGIKRRLFSTNNEADDADNYSDAYEIDKNVNAEEAQPKCVKNSLNKCIDPMIVELFGSIDKEEEKNRARRSLTSRFHSNFKREIDLDESMPNDFQNFLVTSLGGFGSQNREVIKKDVALWERKESSQDANQIAESSPMGGKEDPNSTLEKREVPSSENQKSQTYFPSTENTDSNMVEAMNALNHGDSLRSDSKSKLKSKVEFADEKLPTQIRIQITNASSKEKKSSKPIMEESETTATEMENLPKEKEFFDKSKINTLRMSTLPKLHGLTKSKFSFSDYEEPDTTETENTYRPHRRRRKKKKYIPENPQKPIKDFIKFDQKTMETFLRRIMTDPTMASDQTTQKTPISSRLPQVETVYNPTQGTTKAQLEVSRFGKMNAANNNKNSGTSKNMQSSETNAYDEGLLRNYFKGKPDKIKADKVKEYEDIDWKPSFGKMTLRQDLGWEPSTNSYNLPNLKSPLSDNSYSMNTDQSTFMNPFNQHYYSMNVKSAPTSNYFFHPSSMNSENTNTLYDNLKLKQEMKNLAGDHSGQKMFKKPFYFNNGASLYKTEEKDRNQASQSLLMPSMNMADGSWNYDYLNKKVPVRGYKSRDFLSNTIKSQVHLDPKNKLAHAAGRKFIKGMEDDKSSVLDTPQSSSVLENTKDVDYLDNLGTDEDYMDEDAGKEPASDDPLMPMKFRRIFNSDDDNINEEEEELDEDYDESAEDEDPEDYSLLANTKLMEPELTKIGRKSKFQPSFADDGLSQLNYVYPKDKLLELRGHSFEQTEFTNAKNDAKFTPGENLPLSDIKGDVGALSRSTAILKKANEDANIFGKNLMKSTYGLNADSNLSNQMVENKMKELNAITAVHHRNKLFKRKMDSNVKPSRIIPDKKSKREYSRIGSRLFYAAKTEINDDESRPLVSLAKNSVRSSRNAYCRRNPLTAEFVDSGNGFESESEETGSGNFINLPEEDEKYKEGTRDEEDEVEDVRENLEDDGESISEDNVLENVIGKYIMRKRVASLADRNKSENSKNEEKHVLKKRSLGNQKTHEIAKRLSSGHLTTENNFRKYHKKNLTGKREAEELDSATHRFAANGKADYKLTRKGEGTTQKKRSALDLFKKITNKDRDNKKAENVDGRTAGFEPLSLNDKKFDSSIRDTKFDFLNQVKKLSNEGPQNQMKSQSEFKPQHSSNDQFAGAKKDKLRMKDTPSALTQGPWKIELNDKYDVKFREFPKSTAKLKEVEPMYVSRGIENLKAFLVFNNKLRTLKRNTAEHLSSTSGSSQKEVGNSYGPKSCEGKGISKMNVSKRSLDPSVVTNNNEDAAQMYRNYLMSEQTTETHLNIEEKNRALQDTKSSKAQPLHVLQRSTKKFRSFASNDEQGPNARSPSIGSFNNLKSVFPPSDEANIMRDSRQVNEETSKYLGQQIVDAILSHVSANPKFKELIAPGLPVRTNAYKEDVSVKQQPLQQADFSEQLQYFLQKFMLDLEKLAEKHMRKRMCTQIDQESKEFLRSLLGGNFSVSENDENQDYDDYSELESVVELSTAATPTEYPITMNVEPKLTTSPVASEEKQELDILWKKHCLLLKLIDDYERLTKLEKEALRTNYLYLLGELDNTNKQLGIARVPSYPSPEICKETLAKEKLKSNPGVEFVQKRPPNSTQCENKTFPACQKCSCGNGLSTSGANSDSSQKRRPRPRVLPTYFFEEDVQKRPTTTRPPTFESVDPVNTVGKVNEVVPNASTEDIELTENTNAALLPSPTPQSFDLLSVESSIQETTPGNVDLTTEKSNIRPKVSLQEETEPTAQSTEPVPPVLDPNFDPYLDPNCDPNFDPGRITELHKLSLGDAAGLQLSLKYRGPWVSNLDVAKSIEGVPKPGQTAEGLNQVDNPPSPSSGNSSPPIKTVKGEVDAPTVAEVRNSRSLLAPINANNKATGLAQDKNSYVFDYINYALWVPNKNKPFETFSKTINEAQKIGKFPCHILSKVSSGGRKRSNDLPQASKNFHSLNDLAQSPNILPPSPNFITHSLDASGIPQFHRAKNLATRSDPLKRHSRKRKTRLRPELAKADKGKFNKNSIIIKKSEGTKNMNERVEKNQDDDDVDDLEYLSWSTMPAVRRQLNKLETGLELDDFFFKEFKNSKLNKMSKGEDKPV